MIVQQRRSERGLSTHIKFLQTHTHTHIGKYQQGQPHSSTGNGWNGWKLFQLKLESKILRAAKGACETTGTIPTRRLCVTNLWLSDEVEKHGLPTALAAHSASGVNKMRSKINMKNEVVKSELREGR